MDSLESVLARFSEAAPGHAEQRALLVRDDRKFVLRRDELEPLLVDLSPSYALLRAGSSEIATYDTLYFDTLDLDLFHAHRTGRRCRQKARMRVYPERGLRFLEVKKRIHELRTEKARHSIPWERNMPDESDLHWMSCQVGRARPLRPVAWTRFRRITLLGIDTSERVTVDLDLGFEVCGRTVEFGGLVVVEVKQWPPDRRAPSLRALRAHGHRERSFSKYCSAVCALSGVRRNRLLPTLRTLRSAT